MQLDHCDNRYDGLGRGACKTAAGLPLQSDSDLVSHATVVLKLLTLRIILQHAGVMTHACCAQAEEQFNARQAGSQQQGDAPSAQQAFLSRLQSSLQHTLLVSTPFNAPFLLRLFLTELQHLVGSHQAPSL